MNNEEFIEYQPILYKLFSSSKEKKRLANAYLLYGDINAPVKEVGMLLCESINCQKEILSCHKCSDCKKFDEHVTTDFYFIDGKDKTIKKEDIQKLENFFKLTSLEKNKTPTYLINHIENITNEAINALLKFLEEPKTGVIAILTTNNLKKVLNTIISRSIKVKVNPLPKEKLVNEITGLEYTYLKSKKILTKNEAIVLSWLYSSKEDVDELLNESDDFFLAYNQVEEFLHELDVSITNASYYLLMINYKVNSLKCYNLMYLILKRVFTEILTSTISEDNPYKEVMCSLGKKDLNIKNATSEINRLLSLSRLNLSSTLNSIKIIKALQGEIS